MLAWVGGHARFGLGLQVKQANFITICQLFLSLCVYWLHHFKKIMTASNKWHQAKDGTNSSKSKERKKEFSIIQLLRWQVAKHANKIIYLFVC